MNLIGSILNPTQPQPNPSSGTNGGTSESDNPNTVAPADGSESTRSSGSGTSSTGSGGNSGNGSSSTGSERSNDSGGVNGSTSKSGNSGATSSGNAGLLSRAADNASETRSDEAIRYRAENVGKTFDTERSVVERLFEIDPGAKVTDIISRVETGESDDAKVNSQRFIERLSEIRQSEAPISNDNNGPVVLDTDGSSEAVGRYDKSA